MSKEFKTPKGTSLPILNLKGKDYLQIAQRLVWFREEHPDWVIQTQLVQITDQHCIAKAEICDEKGNCKNTAHKREDTKGFGDFLEKAETGAVGRALAMLGYGTQFCDEFEEGERLADSPIAPHPAPALSRGTKEAAPASVSGYVIDLGKKFVGKRLSEVPPDQLKKDVKYWLEVEKQTGRPLTGKPKVFVEQVCIHLNWEPSKEAEQMKFGPELTEEDIPF